MDAPTDSAHTDIRCLSIDGARRAVAADADVVASSRRLAV